VSDHMDGTMRPGLRNVEVDRLDGDRVAVRWAGPTDAAVAVEVACGDPDGPAERAVEAPVGVTEVVIEGVGEHPRPWFRLSAGGGPHVLAAERRLPVAGTLNFRDLGGYPAAGGKHTAWGRVFRSDNLADVPPDAWRRLHEMGLREVFDLRHDAERERQPSVVPDDLDVATSVLAIGGEAAEAPDVIELLKGGGEGGFGIEYMVTMYETLVADHGSVFATLLTHLADGERLPAVFHCTAGKDRTGVAAALILRLLGVEREVVLDDYELTTRFRSSSRIEALRPTLEAAGIDVEAVRPFLSAPRPALAAALDAIDEAHGSVEAFLLSSGLDAGAPGKLRATLISPT